VSDGGKEELISPHSHQFSKDRRGELKRPNAFLSFLLLLMTSRLNCLLWSLPKYEINGKLVFSLLLLLFHKQLQMMMTMIFIAGVL
jgi:hypothetical protein